MQIIKWVILIIIASAIIPKESVTVQNIGEQIFPIAQTQTITSYNENNFHSLMSLLLINLGELSDNFSHSSPDKKAFLRLYTYTRHSQVYTPQQEQKNFISREFLFSAPNEISYYVYTLHKIII